MAGRKASGLPHPARTLVTNGEEMAFLRSQKCSVGMLLGAGTSYQDLVHPQADLSCRKADSMPQNHFLLSVQSVGNGEMLELTLSGSMSAPCWSLITPMLLCWAPAFFEAAEGIICHLYCSVYSPGSYLQLTIQTMGWRWESSFPSRPFIMDLIAIVWVLHTNINSLSQHPCEIDFDISYFTVEREV